jgi:hypothetical protein
VGIINRKRRPELSSGIKLTRVKINDIDGPVTSGEVLIGKRRRQNNITCTKKIFRKPERLYKYHIIAYLEVSSDCW